MASNILIIEDNRELANLVKLHLSDLNHGVGIAADGPKGLSEASSGKYDLIILDLMLPGMDGLEILKKLRHSQPALPILILTAKSTETDRVVGLELGADDYVAKPFSIPELLARVKALLRRVAALSGSGEEKALIRKGVVAIDPNKRLVTIRGKAVDLTAKEFDLLAHFAARPGIVFTRSQLLNSVWGYAYDGYAHTVNAHINRLRAKIEKDPSRPEIILTVRGVGYKFSEGENPP